jgi:hypothetical protein
MSTARERLTHLVELAGQSAPEKQRALATELCDLLIDWPADYSSAMRAPFEALLERVARGVDRATRRLLATRLAAYAETPLELLNAFFFDLPLESRNAILARNDEAGDARAAIAPDGEAESSLVHSLRNSDRVDAALTLGEFLRVDSATAGNILDDLSAEALAIVCKGAHLARATFSIMALLAGERSPDALDASYARLGRIDTIPEVGAERLLHFWRAKRDTTPVPASQERLDYASA